VPDWTVQCLGAEQLERALRDIVEAKIAAARQVIAQLVAPPVLDVKVQVFPGHVIPEIGMVGKACHKGMFVLSLDAGNPNPARCLLDGTLRRQVAHEVPHCLRMAGPGYGRTFGEALVSEGLAGRLRARSRKSFLVLFFKKEHFFSG